jgi:hypothetical protein
MIGLPKSQEPSECLVVLIRNMHRSEMTAPVKPGKHDGIEAIGLAVIAGLPGDERRSNHLTREAIVGKKTLQNEACAGRFVATSDWSVCREPAEKPTYLHKVTRELHHFRGIARGWKNGGHDGISMDV